MAQLARELLYNKRAKGRGGGGRGCRVCFVLSDFLLCNRSDQYCSVEEKAVRRNDEDRNDFAGRQDAFVKLRDVRRGTQLRTGLLGGAA